jgi:hypothetical protein
MALAIISEPTIIAAGIGAPTKIETIPAIISITTPRMYPHFMLRPIQVNNLVVSLGAKQKPLPTSPPIPRMLKSSLLSPGDG